MTHSVKGTVTVRLRLDLPIGPLEHDVIGEIDGGDIEEAIAQAVHEALKDTGAVLDEVLGIDVSLFAPPDLLMEDDSDGYIGDYFMGTKSLENPERAARCGSLPPPVKRLAGGGSWRNGNRPEEEKKMEQPLNDQQKENAAQAEEGRGPDTDPTDEERILDARMVLDDYDTRPDPEHELSTRELELLADHGKMADTFRTVLPIAERLMEESKNLLPPVEEAGSAGGSSDGKALDWSQPVGGAPAAGRE